MKNYCFIHGALMGNYQEVNDLMLDNVVKSGLYEKLEKIFIGLVGDGDYKREDLDKIEYMRFGQLDEFEFPTLDALYNHCQKNSDSNILYMCNYGVSHANDGWRDIAKSWRELLIHFNIINHQVCLNDLEDGYDISGADWQTDPLPHFCGNWWWAKASYINTLNNIETTKRNLIIPGLNSYRHKAEMWIGSGKNYKSIGHFYHEFTWKNKPARTNWMDYVKK